MQISRLNMSAIQATRKVAQTLKRWESNIVAAILGKDYYVGKDGKLHLWGDRFQGEGTYFHRVLSNERPWLNEMVYDHNLIVDEGIANVLNIILYTEAKIVTWYLGLFNGASAPVAGTNASNVATNLAEITSNTEGYTETFRQTYVGAAASGGIASNTASMASFTIATASSINVVGGFVISEHTRGGTAGALLSAAQFGATRTLFNAEVFQLGYSLQLTN